MFYSLKLNAAYRAGNITYSWLFGYTYQIKFTTYTTDIMPDPYCQIDSICFGDGTRGNLYRNNGPCSGPCSSACEGVVISTNIKMNEYITTHTYPGSGNYMMCLNQPNRNAGVINLPNSVNQPMAFYSYLVIPTFGSGKNTSSVFANHPIVSGCLNNGCVTYNPSATDLDGDSLSYETQMCTSNTGTVAGYSYPYAGAGGTFSINPITGLLSWCVPQYAGDYNVVIKITEWRKDDDGFYYMVGYVERDTELSIGICTGINETTEKENIISVSPNPVTGNLTLSLNQNSDELFDIDIIDLTGRKIKTFLNNESLSKENKVVLNLETINPGIYFLQFIGSNNTAITKKIIKQ
ncbi:MAG: T9SS type A sorting domain-containing protein [Bacteroidia bacterium]|nr:T9SS type A sorting domain-containing protein [Bacteroidota bacterium]MBP9688816.1 T9SS type A sorting domain-containing protein [Bacteroidia bacterium]